MLRLLATTKGGTIFLDEIGELPVDLQAKLLRAMQEKEIRPVGSTPAVPVNLRILAATNRDLDTAVSRGTCAGDLYFRLKRAHSTDTATPRTQARHPAADRKCSRSH